MRKCLTLLLALTLCGPAAAAPEQLHPLTLDEVLDAALKAFPGLLAAEQRKQSAAGEYRTAEGGFDTTLKLQNRWSIAGIYENQNYDMNIEQPTPFGGTTFFGGWRRGTGDYPVYEGKSLTAEDGEVRIGVNIPLWRNREIDRRRASLQQAELGQLIASHEYDQALLELRRIATHRYWDWVLAGQRLRIAERLLAIAERRNDGILERVKAGDIPEFEALDNQRAIIERRERKVAAQRLLEQSAIQLSLYLRGTDGEPLLPDSAQLPPAFPDQEPAVETDLAENVQIAQAQRPELKRIGLQSRQTEIERDLQNNQRAPGVDLSVVGAQDIGQSKDKINRDELYIGLNVDIPLQQRVAGGRAQVAAANLQRLKWERKLLEDRVAAEVKDVLSAIAAARQRVWLSRDQQKAAKQLEEGEQSRFDLGESTLLVVNLREMAHGDAALAAAEAAGALYKAHADYQAAIGNQIRLPE
jgi:cobalt-zinc-cadmium efflux system outer membrane protein